MEFNINTAQKLIKEGKDEQFINRLDFFLSREEDLELKEDVISMLEELVLPREQSMKTYLNKFAGYLLSVHKAEKLIKHIEIRSMTEEEKQKMGFDEIERLFKQGNSEELTFAVGAYLIELEGLDDESFLASFIELVDLKVTTKVKVEQIMNRSELYQELRYS
ncbi:hypothetical protein D3C75_187080 [compost metagenome]